MSDPYGPRDDWTQPRGRPDDEWARDAAHAPGAAHAAGTPAQPTPDLWAEVYGRQHPPKIAGPRESLRGLARALSVLIPMVALVDALKAWDLFTRSPQVFGQGHVYFGVEVGYFYTVGDPPQYVVNPVLFLVAAALFIAWQYKHARNAERLGQQGGLGPGWAVGGWFIPLANLVLPVVQLVQSSGASDPPPDRYRGQSRTSLVVLWAVVFYVSLFELRVVSPDAATVETADTINGVLSLLSIPAAGLAVVMIRTLTKRQETALDARGL